MRHNLSFLNRLPGCGDLGQNSWDPLSGGFLPGPATCPTYGFVYIRVFRVAFEHTVQKTKAGFGVRKPC